MQDDGYHDVASAYQAVSLYEDVWASPVRRLHRVDLGHGRRVGSAGRRPQPRAARRAAARAAHRATTAACTSTSTSTCRSRAAWAADQRMPRPPSSRATRCGAPSSAAPSCTGSPRASAPTCRSRSWAGPAIGTGRGDQLSPALAKGRFDWVVVPSDDGLSTPEVYAHLDVLRATARGAETSPRARAPEVDPGGAAGAARGRPGRARRARAQRPAGRRAVAAAAAARRARARRALRRPRRAWCRGRVRRSPSSPAIPSPHSSCRSRCRPPGRRRCTCTGRWPARA